MNQGQRLDLSGYRHHEGPFAAPPTGSSFTNPINGYLASPPPSPTSHFNDEDPVVGPLHERSSAPEPLFRSSKLNKPDKPNRLNRSKKASKKAVIPVDGAHLDEDDPGLVHVNAQELWSAQMNRDKQRLSGTQEYEIVMNRHVNGIFNKDGAMIRRDPRFVSALYVQGWGDEPDEACKHCSTRAAAPVNARAIKYKPTYFSQCRTISGYKGGACGDCILSAHPKSCSFHPEYERSADGRAPLSLAREVDRRPGAPLLTLVRRGRPGPAQPSQASDRALHHNLSQVVDQDTNIAGADDGILPFSGTTRICNDENMFLSGIEEWTGPIHV